MPHNDSADLFVPGVGQADEESRGSDQASAPKIGGFGIGLAVCADILMGGPLTGAAMNPARHLGPALLGGGFENLWLYWVGPIIGGILAAVCYNKCLEE